MLGPRKMAFIKLSVPAPAAAAHNTMNKQIKFEGTQQQIPSRLPRLGQSSRGRSHTHDNSLDCAVSLLAVMILSNIPEQSVNKILQFFNDHNLN